MDNFIRSGMLLLCAVATMYCGSAIAGVTEGIAAMVKRDYVTALRELRPAAERGDAEAQYRLGRMYEFGQGVPVDKAQAMTWFRKSVAQGNASAQLELGVIYATGDGVAQDDVQAVASIGNVHPVEYGQLGRGQPALQGGPLPRLDPSREVGPELADLRRPEGAG